MKRVLLLVGVAAISLFLFTSSNAFAVDGWASMNGGTTGGAGGSTVTVSDLTQFETYAESSSPYIIQVSGTINIGSGVNVTSNKTIRGLDTSSTLNGQLGFQNGSSNIIIEYLNITNSGGAGEGDGISLKHNISNVFITHCTIYDCTDGCLDLHNHHQCSQVSP